MNIIYKGYVVTGSPEEIKELLGEPVYKNEEKFPCDIDEYWGSGDNISWHSTSTGSDKDIELMRPNEWIDNNLFKFTR